MSWEVKPLGALCSIQLGKTPARKSSRFWDLDKESDNVWLSISDLIHGQAVGESAEYVSNEALPMMKVVPEGTLLVSFKLTLGRTSIAARDLFTNEAIAAILNLNECLNQRFLMHFFERFDWKKACEGDEELKGYTFNKTKLNDLEIPIPPLEEQERIVEVLDEAFAAIDKAKANIERNLTNARELFQSRLNDIFSNPSEDWEVKPLGQICSIRTGKVDVNSGNPAGAYPFFTCARTPTRSDVFAFDCEAILIAGNGEVGLSHYFKGKFQAYQRTYVLSDFNEVLGAYFKYAIDFRLIAHLKSQTQGTAIPYIKKGGLTSCPIVVPSFDEQLRIVHELDVLSTMKETLEESYQSELDNLEELRQSILEQAFEGKLTEPVVA